MTLIGIDVGSSAIKAALFDQRGEQLRLARIECVSAGEFDPEGWWRGVQSALATVADSSVEAIGVCGRGGTNVLLDEQGQVCGPSWDDGRAKETARRLRDTNPPLTPQSLGLLSKARWWQGLGHPVATVCSAKDYVVFRLTGVLVGDEASGGAAEDVPWPELLPARPPWSIAGYSRGGDGWPVGIPVAVGWHDGAAATFGAGAAFAGTASVTLGTTAVYRVVAEKLPPTLRKYWDLTPGLTVTGGDILGAGRTVCWARDLLPNADASASEPGAAGVLFLPQAQGRVAPDVQLAARGAWAGIGSRTTQHDLLRAVLEGIAFALRQVRDWLSIERLVATSTVATGGGSRAPLQAGILADILQQPVQVARFEEGCRGAALLGGVAAGLLSLEEANSLPTPGTTQDPDSSLGDAYEAGFRRWVELQRGTDGVTG